MAARHASRSFFVLSRSSSGSSRGADRTAASAGQRSASPPASLTSRRRVLALGEAALELAGAAAFEINFRAKDDEVSAVGFPANLGTLLPRKTSPELTAQAQDLLQAAKLSVENERYEEAVQNYSAVIETVPNYYTLAQQALLGRARAYEKLGRREEQRQDSIQTWCWGRGIRWPGHYILAYILARRGFVSDESVARTSKEAVAEYYSTTAKTRRGQAARGASSTGRREKSAAVANPGSKQQQQVDQTVTEALIVVALAGIYNYVLYNYGIGY